MKKIFILLAFAILLSGCGKSMIVLQEQGSFFAGGAVKSTPGVFNPKNPWPPHGQTLHGDHAYVFYQVPKKAAKYPLVFLHGFGQSTKTWETTPDGREGFQNIFLRRGYSVYLVDQPRRGDAGRSTLPETITAATDDQMWFTQFRLGLWPRFFPNVAFPKDNASLEQFFRQITPNTGPFDSTLIADSINAIFDKIGSGILVTHSQGGIPGWEAVLKSDKIAAVVSFEPGCLFTFPEGEVPEPVVSSYNTTTLLSVPKSEFMKFTKIPIVIYFGDNIPVSPSDIPAADYWRATMNTARLWADTVNKYGGDVTVVHLPEKGIYGNTHFMFTDLNNMEVADELSAWLKSKGLN